MTTRAPRRVLAPVPVPPPPARVRRRIPVLVPASLAVIFLATLLPSAGEGATAWDGCVFCGDRGLADAILNVGLFAPFGVALARLRMRIAPAVVLASTISIGVEMAQLWIPGRDPSPPDLLFNALGTAAGFAAAVLAPHLLRPSRGMAARLAVGWALLAAGVVAGTGWLTAPTAPRPPFRGQWTPEIGDHPRLPARVLDARLGDVPIPRGTLQAPVAVRDAHLRGDPLRVRWIGEGAAPAPSPLLRIVGRGGDEMLAVFVDGADVLVHRRMRATDARLDRPVHRAAGVLPPPLPGDTLEIVIDFEGRTATVAGPSGAAEDGIGPGRGWALLVPIPPPAPEAARRIDVAWIALLLAPLAFWTARALRHR